MPRGRATRALDIVLVQFLHGSIGIIGSRRGPRHAFGNRSPHPNQSGRFAPHDGPRDATANDRQAPVVLSPLSRVGRSSPDMDAATEADYAARRTPKHTAVDGSRVIHAIGRHNPGVGITVNARGSASVRGD